MQFSDCDNQSNYKLEMFTTKWHNLEITKFQISSKTLWYLRCIWTKLTTCRGFSLSPQSGTGSFRPSGESSWFGCAVHRAIAAVAYLGDASHLVTTQNATSRIVQLDLTMKALDSTWATSNSARSTRPQLAAWGSRAYAYTIPQGGM